MPRAIFTMKCEDFADLQVSGIMNMNSVITKLHGAKPKVFPEHISCE